MVHKVQEVIKFGEALIKTGDLDPIYIALLEAKLPLDQLKRLLLAYFCFYHLGASAFISEMEGETFWQVMEIAARNKLCGPDEISSDIRHERWPRGAERRHFRGDKCVEAIRKLESFGQPERFVGVIHDMGKLVTLQSVMSSIQIFPLFGPWIAFKVADMLERILGTPIEFPNDLTLLYKEPRAALDMLNVPADFANDQLLNHFKKFKAPPRYERPCQINETETVLCKWKSSLGGNYWVGKDIHEVRQGLVGWGDTASKLLSCMPAEVEKGLFA